MRLQAYPLLETKEWLSQVVRRTLLARHGDIRAFPGQCIDMHKATTSLVDCKPYLGNHSKIPMQRVATWFSRTILRVLRTAAPAA
jgi:hypothetical protein